MTDCHHGYMYRTERWPYSELHVDSLHNSLFPSYSLLHAVWTKRGEGALRRRAPGGLGTLAPAALLPSQKAPGHEAPPNVCVSVCVCVCVWLWVCVRVCVRCQRQLLPWHLCLCF